MKNERMRDTISLIRSEKQRYGGGGKNGKREVFSCVDYCGAFREMEVGRLLVVCQIMETRVMGTYIYGEE